MFFTVHDRRTKFFFFQSNPWLFFFDFFFNSLVFFNNNKRVEYAKKYFRLVVARQRTRRKNTWQRYGTERSLSCSCSCSFMFHVSCSWCFRPFLLPSSLFLSLPLSLPSLLFLPSLWYQGTDDGSIHFSGSAIGMFFILNFTIVYLLLKYILYVLTFIENYLQISQELPSKTKILNTKQGT